MCAALALGTSCPPHRAAASWRAAARSTSLMRATRAATCTSTSCSHSCRGHMHNARWGPKHSRACPHNAAPATVPIYWHALVCSHSPTSHTAFGARSCAHTCPPFGTRSYAHTLCPTLDCAHMLTHAHLLVRAHVLLQSQPVEARGLASNLPQGIQAVDKQPVTRGSGLDSSCLGFAQHLTCHDISCIA